MKPILEYIKSRKLDEVTPSDLRTIRSTKWKTPKEIITFLKERGYNKEGEGNNAAVFAKPGSNVLMRVSTDSDKPWYTFYQFAVANSGNPHLPKFGKLKKFKTGHYIVPVERLTPSNSFEFEPDILSEFFAIIETNYANGSIKGKFSFDKYTNGEYQLKIPLSSEAEEGIVEDMKNMSPALLKTFEELFQIALRKNYEMDMNPENFMKRGSTTVIIDPFLSDSDDF